MMFWSFHSFVHKYAKAGFIVLFSSLFLLDTSVNFYEYNRICKSLFFFFFCKINKCTCKNENVQMHTHTKKVHWTFLSALRLLSPWFVYFFWWLMTHLFCIMYLVNLAKFGTEKFIWRFKVLKLFIWPIKSLWNTSVILFCNHTLKGI